MITLSYHHHTQINDHGIEAYPEECCGALLGKINTKNNQKEITKVVRLPNKTTITPEDHKQLEAQAAKEKLELLGFYHTHPDQSAQPSKTDLKFAWPGFSYIILSVIKGKPGTINAFELDLDDHKFVQEKLVIDQKETL